SKPDPLPPGMLEQLAHVRAIFGPMAEAVAPDASAAAPTLAHVDADSELASPPTALDGGADMNEQADALPRATEPQPHDAARPCIGEAQVQCNPAQADAPPAL